MEVFKMNEKINEKTEDKIDELLNVLLSNIIDKIDEIWFCVKYEAFLRDDNCEIMFDELDDMIQKHHRLHAFYMLSYRG
jgi:HKD family nuclease